MKSGMTEHRVIQLLRASCRMTGSQRAWAKKHKMSEAYVSQVLNRTRLPGPAIQRALGIRRVVEYGK